MSKFEKDQIVRDNLTRYRVESGPHLAGGAEYASEKRYLVEVISGPNRGYYRWHPATRLVSSPPAPPTAPPQVGDLGSLVGYVYDPYRLTYLDDQLAVVVDRDGDSKSMDRPRFEKAWRPQS